MIMCHFSLMYGYSLDFSVMTLYQRLKGRGRERNVLGADVSEIVLCVHERNV